MPRLAVVIAAVAMLAGCMKYNADLTVNGDLEVTGTLEIAMQTSALETMGMSKDDFLQQMTSGTDDAPEGVTVEQIDDGEYVGMRVVMDDVPASEFQGTDEGQSFTFTKNDDDDTITFSMPSFTSTLGDLDSSGTDLGADPATLLDEGTIVVTFPGKVLEAPGADIDGNTATWDLTSYTEALTATAEAGGSAGGFPIWIVVVLLAFLVVVALVVWFVLRNRKNGGPDAAAAYAGAYAGAGGGAAGGAGVVPAVPGAPTSPEAAPWAQPQAPAQPVAPTAPSESAAPQAQPSQPWDRPAAPPAPSEPQAQPSQPWDRPAEPTAPTTPAAPDGEPTSGEPDGEPTPTEPDGEPKPPTQPWGPPSS
ncbi:hypothetical protein FH969_07885 [Miniimonas arenae]|uniref:LppM domain-containing protein n=1 Tax=Miniimonas arenae TaxID=676201 RepID=A0A5C5BAY0_9MICO|nr:hypothetical protein [Miniimonas arenae]TNU74123.1 hypothetical protein FH969_07885 [Miniimonas arenae]